MRWLSCFILFLFFSIETKAEGNGASLFRVQTRPYLSKEEMLINFSAVYSAQWTFYLLDQQSVIKHMGSWKNWRKNSLSPHFDKDNFEFNVIKHTLAGQYYYLWYRSRGYSYENSFIWSFISSLAFEFTIETLTERPSYQDIFQTPVYGTLLGMGVEKASVYFHSLDNWYGHVLGYALNPFTLIPTVKETKIVIHPWFDHHKRGVIASLSF